MPGPLTGLKRGDYVHVMRGRDTALAFVALVGQGDNGPSLMLLFNGMLGPFVGALAARWRDGHYEDIETGTVLHLMRFDAAINIDAPGRTTT